MNDEAWLPVEGFEGFYEVSSLGRVRSLARTIHLSTGPRRLPSREVGTGIDGSNGYRRVSLTGHGKAALRRVHAMVAAAFIGPRPKGMVVRHLDSNPGNNAASNLAYGTQSENMKDEVRNGRNWQSAKTSCPRGHALTPENNTKVKANRGHRNCLACTRAYNRVRKNPSLNIDTLSDEIYESIRGQLKGAS